VCTILSARSNRPPSRQFGMLTEASKLGPQTGQRSSKALWTSVPYYCKSFGIHEQCDGFLRVYSAMTTASMDRTLVHRQLIRQARTDPNDKLVSDDDLSNLRGSIQEGYKSPSTACFVFHSFSNANPQIAPKAKACQMVRDIWYPSQGGRIPRSRWNRGYPSDGRPCSTSPNRRMCQERVQAFVPQSSDQLRTLDLSSSRSPFTFHIPTRTNPQAVHQLNRQLACLGAQSLAISKLSLLILYSLGSKSVLLELYSLPPDDLNPFEQLYGMERSGDRELSI